MDYRVEQLAAACDVSVDTVRYYQTRGLIPPPRREGRVALYDADHAKRIRKIRALQTKGLTLSVIERVLAGRLGRGDADLAAAVAAAQTEADDEGFLTQEDVAERSGVPTALLRAVQRAGLNIGRRIDGEERYTDADVQMVRMGLRLLETGFPINELIAIASSFTDTSRAVAERAVELFDEHVRKPVRASGMGDEDAAAKLVAAFRELLPAVTALAAHQFRRVLLSVAEEHIERVGDEHEIAASRAESRRMRETAWNG